MASSVTEPPADRPLTLSNGYYSDKWSRHSRLMNVIAGTVYVVNYFAQVLCKGLKVLQSPHLFKMEIM